MKIAVTGSHGYIGRHFCEFAAENNALLEIDRNIPTDSPRFHHHGYQGDLVSDASSIYDRLKHFDPHVIVNLAGMPSVEACREHPGSCYHSNYLAARAAASFAGSLGIPLVHASSAAVYSISGDDPKLGHDNPYAFSKALAEWQLLADSNLTQATILRLFNVYPSPEGVIYKWASRGKATMDGSGGSTRDYIHISDVVQALWRACVFNCRGKYVMDIGTGTGASLLYLAEAMGLKTEYTNKAPTGPPHSVADPERAFQLLGFKAKLALREGLTQITVP